MRESGEGMGEQVGGSPHSTYGWSSVPIHVAPKMSTNTNRNTEWAVPEKQQCVCWEMRDFAQGPWGLCTGMHHWVDRSLTSWLQRVLCSGFCSQQPLSATSSSMARASLNKELLPEPEGHSLPCFLIQRWVFMYLNPETSFYKSRPVVLSL